jgi:release factor glutamine methyltransferase
VTVKQALGEASARFSAAGIDTPSLDAALLLAEALGTSRARLVLAWDNPLGDDRRRRFDGLVERRLSGEPVAYILGRKEFFGLDFAVNPDVLIPRPDTETLVEAALETAREMARNNAGDIIAALDLCTGSGAAAIALKHEMPELAVYASDISPEALACARDNAARLLGENSVTFIEGDLFSASGSAACGNAPERAASGSAAFDNAPENAAAGDRLPRRFNLIISNPPYIPAPDIPFLQPEVRREPRLALDGGQDGLGLIRRIIAESPDRLAPGGALLLEADPRQMDAVSGVLASFGYGGVKTYNDLSQRPRVIRGFCPSARA